MSTLTSTLGRTEFYAPRPWWRRVLLRLMAIDALARERHHLAELDDRILSDIGMNRADVETALSRPDKHLRLILMRCDQFEN